MRSIILFALVFLAVLPADTLATFGKLFGGSKRHRNSGYRRFSNSYPSRYSRNSFNGYGNSGWNRDFYGSNTGSYDRLYANYDGYGNLVNYGRYNSGRDRTYGRHSSSGRYGSNYWG